MPVPPPSSLRLKAAVTVTSMAKAVRLSRSQFYQYVKRGVFPQPSLLASTQRPYYTADAQQAILEVRQSGIGCNGEYVLFYERTSAGTGQHKTATRNGIGDKALPNPTDLVARLAEVGLSASPDQVREAIATCFPGGTTGLDDGAVLRAVNRHLRRPPGSR